MDTRKLLALGLVAALVALLTPQNAAALDDAPNYNSASTTEQTGRVGFRYARGRRPGPGSTTSIEPSMRSSTRTTFAIDMYENSASWAYKPAQYNLAVMYMNGEGVPVDKPRAMAWAALAAERSEQEYVTRAN